MIIIRKCKYAVEKKTITNTIDQKLNPDESDDEPDNDKSNEFDED